MTSKIDPTAEGLKRVNIRLLDDDGYALLLLCLGCFKIFSVPHRATRQINWFACPSPTQNASRAIVP